jgi:hypothetical protein
MDGRGAVWVDIDRVEALKRSVYEDLRQYGQYLAMQGAAPGEQRFSIPEIVLAVTSLVGWATGIYAKAFLQELGRLHAGRRDKDRSIREAQELIARLERALNAPRVNVSEIDSVLGGVLDELGSQQDLVRCTLVVSEDVLIEQLRRLGLTNRAARQLAPRLARTLETGLNAILGDSPARSKEN